MFTDKDSFKTAFIEKLQNSCGICLDEASDMDKYMALGSLIRDLVTKNWVQSNNHYLEKGEKEVYYFSLEFLLGRLLGSNLLNIDLMEVCKEGLEELGIDLNELENQEADAGLGNGGLGRLAACFLDSLASLSLPGHGCGIRYKYGFFEQRVVDGYQVELPDHWLRDGNVWEIRKNDRAVEVRFYGNVKIEEEDGKIEFIHENYEPVMAVPYDVPIIGYKNNTVNTLRLWSAEAADVEFNYVTFSHGDYLKAVEYKDSIEAISQILYPDDNHFKGRELRLKQQYFFVSAGVQSIIRRHKRENGSINDLHKRVAIHINDTHPTLAIPEMMRILMDEEGLGWDEAWEITRNTVSYTNHTIMSEALEKWPVDMIRSLLPRIYMIIQEINEKFCCLLWEEYPGDWQRIARMAIIANDEVKMAHLALVGSYSVNGVSEIHSEILKNQVMREFGEFYPEKFNNKTNGVTHRRWLIKANPGLTRLITETIGPKWIKEPDKMLELLNFSEDAVLQDKLAQTKYENRIKLARFIKNKYDIDLDLHSIFDVQVKRMHAYKRQILNVLHIMHLYNMLKDNPALDITPRTFIFGAKAAPSYYMAKTIIKLINTVASVVNNDKDIKDKIKVVFLENYRVSLAEMIFPAADLSEQISTAGKEASGTGNMKFMMNGAVTIGTMDGANIEIREAVNDDNIFIFGLSAKEVMNYYHCGGYNSWDIYHSDERLKRVLDQLVNGFFPVAPEEFRNLYNSLLENNDDYFVLKDFSSYADAQDRVDKAFQDKSQWRQMCITNIAHSGRFSSDRTISEYAEDIWNIKSKEN